MLSGLIDQQNNLGAVIADWVGFKGEAIKVETACSSGASAFRAGIVAVASGEINSALVVGVEKMTDSAPGEVTGRSRHFTGCATSPSERISPKFALAVRHRSWLLFATLLLG